MTKTALPGDLRHIFLFRHGDYEGRGFLTDRGRAQMDFLALQLKNGGFLSEGKTAEISSDWLRAIKSRQRFSYTAGTEKLFALDDAFEALRSDEILCNVEAAASVLDSFVKAQTLVLFTHAEMMQMLPHQLALLLTTDEVPDRMFSYGEGVHFDLFSKKVTLITQPE